MLLVVRPDAWNRSISTMNLSIWHDILVQICRYTLYITTCF